MGKVKPIMELRKDSIHSVMDENFKWSSFDEVLNLTFEPYANWLNVVTDMALEKLSPSSGDVLYNLQDRISLLLNLPKNQIKINKRKVSTSEEAIIY